MISVLIINYNTPELVKQAVASVYKYMKDLSFEVIVVDNASSKGSIEKALTNFPEVILIKSKENIGFGRANNLGFKHGKGDFIFLLNSDAYLIDSTSVSMMIEYLNQHENVGIVGPNFLKADGSKNYAYGNLLGFRKIISDMGIWEIPNESKTDFATFKVCDSNSTKEVGYLAAAGIIIKRSVIEQLGLFDPKFFLYFEDMELGWRYSKNGFKSVLLPEATIIHLGGASSGTQSPTIARYIFNSKKYYLRKTLGVFKYLIVQLLDLILLTIKKIRKRLNS